MKIKLTFFLLVLAQILTAQDKLDYLSTNKVDLRQGNPNISETDFNIIGFGALHGSSKPYEAELKLVSSLIENELLDYYIIEANYSQAFYFQEYLRNGDEKLLKELVFAFQTLVSQEGTIETFNHWKNVRALQLKYPDKPIKVIGCDVIHEYKFPIRHILSITEEDTSWTQRQALEEAIGKAENTTIWNQDLNKVVKPFFEDYLSNTEKYAPLVKDAWTLNLILQTMKRNFEDNRDREKIIYDNYMSIKSKFGLENKKQFAKYGYFHIQKYKEGNYPSFFTRLIENEIYDRTKVVTVMAYMTKSKVLWDKKYDKKGDYTGYTTKAGFGISDYWKEYFKGIKYLKKSKISDLTMFKLNNASSPYSEGTDLVEIKMFLKDYNTKKLKGKNTLQFIDYAILVSDSKEQVPIEEME